MTKKSYLLVVIVGLFAAIGFGRNSFAGAGGPPVTESFDLTGDLFTNPCDTSGSSDVTATSGSVDETIQTINLPDGTQNVHVRESVQGVGTDSNNNVYKIGGMVVVDEVRSATESEVVIIKFHSPTGTSFVSIFRVAELRNHDLDHQKNICLGN